MLIFNIYKHIKRTTPASPPPTCPHREGSEIRDTPKIKGIKLKNYELQEKPHPLTPLRLERGVISEIPQKLRE